jgi:spermidine dehydrogenase
MNKKDRLLGMDRDITRRDFIHDLSLASLGLALPASAAASTANGATAASDAIYPPVRTGMRGSHPGAFEVAHALALDGKSFRAPTDLDEAYDLIVVGGGISGLAAAYYYRKRFGTDARILILDNHDDFGGHAKRNEFHQGGRMRLSWGGTMNLEYPWFSDEVNELLAELGVDIDTLLEGYHFVLRRGEFRPRRACSGFQFSRRPRDGPRRVDRPIPDQRRLARVAEEVLCPP